MELGLPKGIDLINNFDSLEIVRQWFSPQIIFLTFFMVFWDGFLIVWYAMALHLPLMGPGIVALVFPLLHVAVGIGGTYSILAGYINRTCIRVDHSFLSIIHAPLPFWGNKTVSASDVKQVYSKECVSRSGNGASATFQVNVLTHSGKNIKLLSGLPNSEQALFIEQQIEKFLCIEDVPVRGEITR